MMESGKALVGDTEADLGRWKGIRPTEIVWKGKHILEGQRRESGDLGWVVCRFGFVSDLKPTEYSKSDAV